MALNERVARCYLKRAEKEANKTAFDLCMGLVKECKEKADKLRKHLDD